MNLHSGLALQLYKSCGKVSRSRILPRPLCEGISHESCERVWWEELCIRPQDGSLVSRSQGRSIAGHVLYPQYASICTTKEIFAQRIVLTTHDALQ